jgi:hypothetical protein
MLPVTVDPACCARVGLPPSAVRANISATEGKSFITVLDSLV